MEEARGREDAFPVESRNSPNSSNNALHLLIIQKYNIEFSRSAFFTKTKYYVKRHSSEYNIGNNAMIVGTIDTNLKGRRPHRTNTKKPDSTKLTRNPTVGVR